MKYVVLTLQVLLAARVVYALRRCEKMPMSDAVGEVGTSRTIAIVLGGCVLLLNLLLCAGALLDPQHVGLFLGCMELVFTENYLRSVLRRIQWGPEGFVFRDGRGRLHACAWADVRGGERTCMRFGRSGERAVRIVHTADFSVTVVEEQGADFLAELKCRCGELPPLRPARGPWHGRVKDADAFEADNILLCLLGAALLSAATEVIWCLPLGGMFLAAGALRVALSKRINVPTWLVRVLFLDGNCFF